MYGGAISVYMGSYSSNHSEHGAVMAVVGDTLVRNVSLTLDKAQFTDEMMNLRIWTIP